MPFNMPASLIVTTATPTIQPLDRPLHHNDISAQQAAVCVAQEPQHAGWAPGGILASGFAELNAELPGGGWPLHAVTEILQAPNSWLEWRLLLPALEQAVRCGQIGAERPLWLVGSPWPQHLPGLAQAGVPSCDVRSIRSQGQRMLAAAAQALRSGAVGAMILWLPQERSEPLRRLHALAQAAAAPVFVLREIESTTAAPPRSVAPLQVLLGIDASSGVAVLRAHILKRLGTEPKKPLVLAPWPMGLNRSRDTSTPKNTRRNSANGEIRPWVQALLDAAAANSRQASSVHLDNRGTHT